MGVIASTKQEQHIQDVKRKKGRKIEVKVSRAVVIIGVKRIALEREEKENLNIPSHSFSFDIFN